MVKRYTISLPNPDGYEVKPWRPGLFEKPTEIVTGKDYDELKTRLTKLANAHVEVTARLAEWETECGPLLDYLTGSSKLCKSPVDYAKELRDRAVSAEARVAEAEAERDNLRSMVNLIFSIPAMTDQQLRDLHAECQKVIDRAAHSASVNQCDGCRRGLPLVNGIHRGEGYDLIGCTADRYTAETVNGDRK